jgi:hypothetical protein
LDVTLWDPIDGVRLAVNAVMENEEREPEDPEGVLGA